MARLGSSGAVVILCPFPAQAAATEAAGWLRANSDTAAPVTWITTPDGLERLRDVWEAAPTTTGLPGVAVSLEPESLATKTSLRAALRQARTAWPDLTAAVLRAGGGTPHRDVLVQEGITTLCVDAFDEPARGSRRPAPQGWPCRSILWGLWEVASAPARRVGLVRRMAGWCTGSRNARGGLVILDADSGSGMAVARARLERHRAWARRRIQAGTVEGATLADLPRLIAGGNATGSPGSILRAA